MPIKKELRFVVTSDEMEDLFQVRVEERIGFDDPPKPQLGVEIYRDGGSEEVFIPLPMVPDVHKAIAQAVNLHYKEEAERKLLLDDPLKADDTPGPQKCSGCGDCYPDKFHVAFYDPFDVPAQGGSAGYYRNHLCMGCYFDYLSDSMGTRAQKARKEAEEKQA